MGRPVGLHLGQSEPGRGSQDQSLQGSGAVTGQVAANQGGAGVKPWAVGLRGDTETCLWVGPAEGGGAAGVLMARVAGKLRLHHNPEPSSFPSGSGEGDAPKAL